MTTLSSKKIVLQAFVAIMAFTIASVSFAGTARAASPRAETDDADVLSSTQVKMNGVLNPRGEETTYWFEYGTSRSNLNRETSQRDVNDFNAEVNVSNTVSGLARHTTYYFRIVAENSDGSSRGDILSFDTDDTNGSNSGNLSVDTLSAQQGNGFVTLNGEVDSDSDGVETWFRYGTSRSNLNLTTAVNMVVFSNGVHPFSRSISNLVSGTTYYYQAAARGSDGTEYGDVLSFTFLGSGNGGGSTGTNVPSVSTNSANVLGGDAATLRAQVNPNGALTAVWFQYGRTLSLGSATTRDPAGSGTGFNAYSTTVTNLTPGTTYYYRAAAQSPSGASYGQILSFRTTGTAPSNPPSGGNANGTSNNGGNSSVPPATSTIVDNTSGCFSVSPAINSPQLNANDDFTYSVTYRNNCSYGLASSSLQITLPPGTDFAGTNYSFLSRDGNVITYSLGAIAPNFQSAVTVTGKVRSQVTAGDVLTFQANLTYSDMRGNTQSASGYLTATVTEGGDNASSSSNGLGASAADALGGLFHSGWFWLVLFLILVALFVFWLATRRRADEEDEEEETEAAHH